MAIMLLSAGSLFVQALPVPAQENDEKADPPVNITSDKMVAEKAARLIKFSGNVVAERENSTLNADHVDIYFNEDEDTDGKENRQGDEDNGKKRKIKKIIAYGNVVYTSETRKAFADRAEYTAEDETLVLTGKAPRLATEDSFIEGEKITLHQKTDQVVVERGDEKRVNALINPEDTERKE